MNVNENKDVAAAVLTFLRRGKRKDFEAAAILSQTRRKHKNISERSFGIFFD